MKHYLCKCHHWILRATTLFLVCGSIYYMMELIWDGSSHFSMFILAGLCAIFFIDLLNNIYSMEMDYLLQVGISTILCTIAEGVTGLIVNTWLGLNVWDYSSLPFNFFYGQCCLYFVFLWIAIIGFLGIPVCDAINYYVFKIEPCPYYKINGKIIFKFKELKGKENE